MERDSVKMSTVSDTTSGHLGYEATCMKLRRTVIMIIACNRLKKLSTRQTQTVIEEEQIHKCFSNITGHKNS